MRKISHGNIFLIYTCFEFTEQINTNMLFRRKKNALLYNFSIFVTVFIQWMPQGLRNEGHHTSIDFSLYRFFRVGNRTPITYKYARTQTARTVLTIRPNSGSSKDIQFME